MKVFKFGGASVSNIDRIKGLKNIVQQFSTDQLVIIISAMGETTNGLEKVVEAFFAGRKEDALQLFNIVKHQHLTTAKYLLIEQYHDCFQQLNDFFTEVEWLLHDKPVRTYDYYYDQIVCVGELLSTCIISYYLKEEGVQNNWLDVRDLLRTDNNFRDASIDWDYSIAKVKEAIQPIKESITIIQGFIGSTDDNESTTLGREGSDYTAAVFANMLDAESLTIWKDVEGILSADPKLFPEATLIKELSYAEVIEMAFYGAKVIHPKTIKPLQNKHIPLWVKSFIDISLPGTCIHTKSSLNLPPIIVLKNNQVLLHLKTTDFSFINGNPTNYIYSLLKKVRINPNIIQTGAISIELCVDDYPEKISAFAQEASIQFDVQIEKELTLLTIRHYREPVVKSLLLNKEVILQQQTRNTLQCIYRTN